MKRRLAFALAATLCIGSAQAHPITFEFLGTITDDPFGMFGTASSFMGTYTFDSNATPIPVSNANSGAYSGTEMTVSFAGTLDPSVSGPFLADTLQIAVNNDFSGPVDQYLVTGFSSSVPQNAFSLEIFLENSSATVFNNTALPLTPPNLAAFDTRRFSLVDDALSTQAMGVLTALRCTAGCVASIPEPPPLALFAVALGTFALTRRRGTPS